MRPASPGFTLIEVLVAFAILVLALATLHQGYGLSLGAAGRVDAQTLAIARAQSKLAEAGVTRPLVPGRAEGRYADGRHWIVTIDERKNGDDAGRSQVKSFDVTVEIQVVRAGASVRLRTVKLGSAS